jgi:hypothetical protein
MLQRVEPLIMEPRAFRTGVIEELRRFLESEGLRKRAGLVFTGKPSEGTLRWVGLSTVTRHAGLFISVTPVVGVRNQAVERLVAALRGVEFHSFAPATLAAPLANLTPGRTGTSLVFMSARGTAGPLAVFRSDFRRYGAEFCRRHSSLPELCTGLERADLGFPQARFRLPACYYLLGRREEAIAFVATNLSALRNTGKKGLAREYEEYADRLTRLCRGRSDRQG